MKTLILAIMIMATQAQGAEIWSDKGFKVETGGWQRYGDDAPYMCIEVGVTIPEGGYAYFRRKGAWLLHLPCKGWVEDMGIGIGNRCEPPNEYSRRFTGDRDVNVTREMGCDSKRSQGRVLMLVRIPNMNLTRGCHPDSLKWVANRGGYYVEED